MSKQVSPVKTNAGVNGTVGTGSESPYNQT